MPLLRVVAKIAVRVVSPAELLGRRALSEAAGDVMRGWHVVILVSRAVPAADRPGIVRAVLRDRAVGRVGNDVEEHGTQQLRAVVGKKHN